MRAIHGTMWQALALGWCVFSVPHPALAQTGTTAGDQTSRQDDTTSGPDTTANKAPAQEQAKDAVDLSQIVVSSGIQYRNHIDTPAPVLVYDQQFFAKFEPVSVGDQLRRVPGVAFVGDIGESVAPELRGLGHGYTQILINGRPVPGIGNDRSVAVDRIPAEIIDRIELVRSPSADIDSNGVGGTINIILKDGATLPPGVILRVGAMLDKKTGRIRPNAAISWSGRSDGGDVSYSVTVDAQKRFNEKHAVQGVFDGDSQGFDDEVAAGGMGRALQNWDDRSKSAATEREEQGDQRESKDLSFNGDLTWKINPGSTLRFDAYALTTRRTEREDTLVYSGDGSPGGFDYDDIEVKGEDVKTDEDSRGASVTWNKSLGDSTDLEMHLGHDHIDGGTLKTKYKDGVKDSVEDETATDTDWLADIALTHQMSSLASSMNIDGAQLKVGIQAKDKDRDYGLLSDTKLSKSKPLHNDGTFRYEEKRLDAFGMIDWYFNPAVTLTTGVRLETTRTRQTYSNVSGAGGEVTDVSSGSADSKVTMLNPSAHLQWKLGDNDQLRFSVARTVKRPSIDQLIPAVVVESPEDYDVTVGNPDLKMERALGFDIGYEHRLGSRGIIGTNLFWRDIDDLIGLVRTGRSVSEVGQDPDDYPGGLYTYMNLGKAKVHGIEFDLSTPLTAIGLDNTGLFGNYTRLFSTRPDPITGRDIRIDDQPTYVYNIGLTQDIPSWNTSFGASYQRQGHSMFVTIGEMEKTEYDGNLEFFLEKRLGERLVLRLTGSNLLDSCSYQMEPNFDGDSSAEIQSNQAAYIVDHFEVERECSSPRWSLTLRAVF